MTITAEERALIDAFPEERITICPPGANTFTYPHWDGSKLTMGGERGEVMKQRQRAEVASRQRAARLRRAEGLQ